MSPRLFFTSLLAVNVTIQLLRFPYLILENGGGAFLLLFFLSLHGLSLPMLVVEKALDKKLKKLNLPNFSYLKSSSLLVSIDSVLVFAWLGLRFSVLLCFLWFFLYLGGTSFLYTLSFGSYSFGLSQSVMDSPNLPNLQFSLFGALLWAGSLFSMSLFFKEKFFNFSMKWLLPFCFASLLLLFLKIVKTVDLITGLKVLLYPDFASLTPQSLLGVIGHSLVCLGIGLGFYDSSLFKNSKVDPINIFIMSVLQVIVVAVLVGTMALPMMEQVSEYPFGSSWIFEILPRWLSYGDFGYYYCWLFFMTFSFLGAYLSLVFMDLLVKNMSLFNVNIKSVKYQKVWNALFVLVSATVVMLLQRSLSGWSGQGTLLVVDSLLIHWGMPLLALLMVWFAFRYTSRKERMSIFSQQQVFFHSQVIFNIWEKYSRWLIPSLILLSWFLVLI